MKIRMLTVAMLILLIPSIATAQSTESYGGGVTASASSSMSVDDSSVSTNTQTNSSEDQCATGCQSVPGGYFTRIFAPSRDNSPWTMTFYMRTGGHLRTTMISVPGKELCHRMASDLMKSEVIEGVTCEKTQ